MQVLIDEISTKFVDAAFKAEKASAKPSKIDVFVEAVRKSYAPNISARLHSP